MKEKKQTQVVFIDDNKMLIAAMISFAFSDKQVAVYHNPSDFLNDILTYEKNAEEVLFCIDQHFKNSPIKGIDIAKKLHEMGLKKLYLISGEELDDEDIPEYLTTISKTDLDSVEHLSTLC